MLLWLIGLSLGLSLCLRLNLLILDFDLPERLLHRLQLALVNFTIKFELSVLLLQLRDANGSGVARVVVLVVGLEALHVPFPNFDIDLLALHLGREWISRDADSLQG